MMQEFFYLLGQNLRQKTPATLGVLTGLLAVGFIVGGVIDELFWTGPFVLVVSILVTFWAASRVKQLSWFFGEREQPVSDEDHSATKGKIRADSSDDTAEHASQPSIAEPVELAGALTPREAPVGTSVVSIAPDQAVVRVNSVIHFWCWFAPLALGAGAFLATPLGALIGYQLYKQSVPWHQFEAEAAFYASFWGGTLVFGLFIAAAIWSYFANRPKVKVLITPDAIRYGDILFDRRHAAGLRIGYKSHAAELKANITDDRFGVSRLRLAYGNWGEDLKYMVNSYHADEIVIWLNGIINNVGAPPPKQYDPNKGTKPELL
ncbi:hypothetical protein QTA57_17980 [Fontisubflavum oceani]|uniref:hypothetical protein n=1 Tax=Fontisubflavum oceani TaxID=2978973 RepID=UPI0025B3781D|nr:hypothetical protein [Fontisubflavum oceani]WJY21589.1 hypothetical protein QTA57_17980 [Fontisubflavum oceani]